MSSLADDGKNAVPQSQMLSPVTLSHQWTRVNLLLYGMAGNGLRPTSAILTLGAGSTGIDSASYVHFCSARRIRSGTGAKVCLQEHISAAEKISAPEGAIIYIIISPRDCLEVLR